MTQPAPSTPQAPQPHPDTPDPDIADRTPAPGEIAADDVGATALAERLGADDDEPDDGAA